MPIVVQHQPSLMGAGLLSYLGAAGQRQDQLSQAYDAMALQNISQKRALAAQQQNQQQQIAAQERMALFNAVQQRQQQLLNAQIAAQQTAMDQGFRRGMFDDEMSLRQAQLQRQLESDSFQRSTVEQELQMRQQGMDLERQKFDMLVEQEQSYADTIMDSLRMEFSDTNGLNQRGIDAMSSLSDQLTTAIEGRHISSPEQAAHLAETLRRRASVIRSNPQNQHQEFGIYDVLGMPMEIQGPDGQMIRNPGLPEGATKTDRHLRTNDGLFWLDNENEVQFRQLPVLNAGEIVPLIASNGQVLTELRYDPRVNDYVEVPQYGIVGKDGVISQLRSDGPQPPRGSSPFGDISGSGFGGGFNPGQQQQPEVDQQQMMEQAAALVESAASGGAPINVNQSPQVQIEIATQWQAGRANVAYALELMNKLRLRGVQSAEDIADPTEREAYIAARDLLLTLAQREGSSTDGADSMLERLRSQGNPSPRLEATRRAQGRQRPRQPEQPESVMGDLRDMALNEALELYPGLTNFLPRLNNGNPELHPAIRGLYGSTASAQ